MLQSDQNDPFDLQRFITAQNRVIDQVRAELNAGRKTSHWMWFIFPQLRGLGYSETANYYGISGLDEAIAYLADPVLGPRLIECVQILNAYEGRTAQQIFGYPDWLKFHSSMTLFHRAAPDSPAFRDALKKFFNGEEDSATTQHL